MKCNNCIKKGSYKAGNKNYCKSHFLNNIEKRVRKEIRINQLIQKNDNLLILDDNSQNFTTANFLLTKIITDPTITITIKKKLSKTDKEKYSKIIIPITLDDKSNAYIKALFENTSKLNETKIIEPISVLTNEEVLQYSKLHNLIFELVVKKDDYQVFIDNLENKYPGLKFGILKTIKKLK